MSGTYASRWSALIALSLVVLAVGLDATVLAVALPTLAVSLHASTSQLQWISSGYLLAVAVALLPGGLLGDRFGRKKLLLITLAVFGLGSAACAYSRSPVELISSRILLGLGAAFLAPLVLSVITVLFTEEERPKAVGTWAAATFLSFPIGPILGGWMLTHFWWGSVFLINIPIVGLAIIATAILVPESRAARTPSLDPVGVVGSSAGLAAVTYGLIEAGQVSWGSVRALVPLAAGLAILVLFVMWERRLGNNPGGQPLLDLHLFRSRLFTWGTLLSAVAIFAMFGVTFAIPQYFQAIKGVSAQGSGIRLLPLIGGFVVSTALSNPLTRAIGVRFVTAIGFLVLTAGMVCGAVGPESLGLGFLIAWTSVVGVGMGFSMVPAASVAVSQLPAERSGVGSAMMQTIQKVASPLGVALLGSLLSSTYRSNLHLGGIPDAAATLIRSSVFAGVAIAQSMQSSALLKMVHDAFMRGFDATLWACAGIAALGTVLGLIFLPRHQRGTDTGQVQPAEAEVKVR